MDYLLDTNIIVIYGRSTEIADKIEADLGLFNGENDLAVSVVTLGELDSLAKADESAKGGVSCSFGLFDQQLITDSEYKGNSLGYRSSVVKRRATDNGGITRKIWI